MTNSMKSDANYAGRPRVPGIICMYDHAGRMKIVAKLQFELWQECSCEANDGRAQVRVARPSELDGLPHRRGDRWGARDVEVTAFDDRI